MTADDTDGITVTELARRLGCSRTKVYNLIRDGWLKVLPGPGVTLVTRASYRDYLASARGGEKAIERPKAAS